MTDNEIIKVIPLEDRIEHYNKRLKEVFDSYYRRHTDGAEETLEICVLRESSKLTYTLHDLINRQKAEIERLTDTLNATIAGQETLQRHIKTAKAEAIKAFAERLKDMHKHNTTSVVSLVTVFDNINNLVKEMVGDN